MAEGQFQVLRVEKLKSAARVSMRLAHALRDHVPDNADKDRLKENHYQVPGVGDAHALKEGSRTQRAMGLWRSKLPEKHRKDAVLALEFLISGSKERMGEMSRDEQTRYLQESASWLISKMGGSANVVAFTIHQDETTPHASLFVVPLKDGKLNAKAYINGPKALSELQTAFQNDVAGRYGLDRGVVGSNAVHTSIKEFYALGKEVIRRRQLSLAQKRAEPEIRRDLDQAIYSEDWLKLVQKAKGTPFEPVVEKYLDARGGVPKMAVEASRGGKISPMALRSAVSKDSLRHLTREDHEKNLAAIPGLSPQDASRLAQSAVTSKIPEAMKTDHPDIYTLAQQAKTASQVESLLKRVQGTDLGFFVERSMRQVQVPEIQKQETSPEIRKERDKSWGYDR